MQTVSNVAKQLVADQAEPAGEVAPPPRATSPAPPPIVEEDMSEPEPEPAVRAEAAKAVSRAQVGKIKGEYERLGIADRDQQLAWSMTLLRLADGLASHNDLGREDASALIEVLVGAQSVEDLDDAARGDAS
jgi:hypothetical protein